MYAVSAVLLFVLFVPYWRPNAIIWHLRGKNTEHNISCWSDKWLNFQNGNRAGMHQLNTLKTMVVSGGKREIMVSAEVHGNDRERVEHVHSVSGREFRMVTQNAAWSWETWQTRCVVQDELSERETSEHRLQWLYQQTDLAAGFIAAKSMAKWWICSIQNLSRGQYLDAILRSCTRARVSLYLSPALSATY